MWVLFLRTSATHKNEFYGDSVDIRHETNGDLSVIKVYTNGDLRYTVIREVKKHGKASF